MEDLSAASNFEFGLDFVGVNDSGDVGVTQDGSLEVIVLLFSGSISVGTEDGVQGRESGFSPNNKSAELTSGGEFQKVQTVDVGNGDSGHVSEGLGEFDVFGADNDEGTLTGVVAVVSPLATAASEGAGVDNAFDVFEGADAAEPGDGVLGSFDVFNGVVEDKGQFVDAIDSVTAGLDEGDDGGGSDGRADGVTLLGHIDTTVPSSPGFQGGEHATLSALVTEGTLA